MFSFGNFSSPSNMAFGSSYTGQNTSGNAFGGYGSQGFNAGGSFDYNRGNNGFSGSVSQHGGVSGSYREGFGGSRSGPDVSYNNGTTSVGMTRDFSAGTSVGGGVFGGRNDYGAYAHFSMNR